MSELPAVQHASNSCDSAVLFCGTESYLYIVAEALREVAVSLLCFLLLKGFLTTPKGRVSFSPRAKACSVSLKVFLLFKLPSKLIRCLECVPAVRVCVCECNTNCCLYLCGIIIKTEAKRNRSAGFWVTTSGSLGIVLRLVALPGPNLLVP